MRQRWANEIVSIFLKYIDTTAKLLVFQYMVINASRIFKNVKVSYLLLIKYV